MKKEQYLQSACRCEGSYQFCFVAALPCGLDLEKSSGMLCQCKPALFTRKYPWHLHNPASAIGDDCLCCGVPVSGTSPEGFLWGFVCFAVGFQLKRTKRLRIQMQLFEEPSIWAPSRAGFHRSRETRLFLFHALPFVLVSHNSLFCQHLFFLPPLESLIFIISTYCCFSIKTVIYELEGQKGCSGLLDS